MPKDSKAKKNKTTGDDDGTPFDVSKLSDKQRTKILAQLMKDGKKRDKDAKKARKDKERADEEAAERAYQASKKATTRTPDAPRAVVPSTRTGPKKNTAQVEVEDASEQEADSTAEKNSADDYESGNEAGIPIDPVLLGQSRRRESSGEEEQPAKKKTKAGTGNAVKTAPTPAKKPKGSANVTVGSSQPLEETAASKKKLVPIALSSDDSSSDESSQTSDSDARKRAPIGPHTPYKAPGVHRGKNAPNLRDLSPTTKSMTEEARTKYSVYLATEDAFPSEKNARRTARKLFIAEIDSAAQDDDEEDEDAARRERRGERAKADKTYREHVNNMVTGVDSSFRGHVVDDAVPLVEGEYGLITGELDETGVADRVGRLLEDGSFTFKDWEQRDGAFQCPILPKLLRKAFLTKQVKKGHALGLGPNFHTFSEVSPPLLAFLLTAIECVLRRWQTGKYELSHFTMTKYEPIYTKHLEALHQTEVTSPGTLGEIRKDIWATACKTAGIAAPTKVRELDHRGGYMRPEDLAKIRRQQPDA